MKIIYADRKTRSAFGADVVISGLQKFIRRADIPRSLACANELSMTDNELSQYMWSRLMVISVEDIGMGDPMASVRVYQRYCASKKKNINQADEIALYSEAIIDLCGCYKDRGSCVLAQLIRTLAKHSESKEGLSELIAYLNEGKTEQAAMCAYAIAKRGRENYDDIWNCLLSFARGELSHEPNAAALVETLNRMRTENYKDNGIHPMYFTHAIRYLCCLKNGVEIKLREHSHTEGKACKSCSLLFPSYVFDKHTQIGQANGRDELHFLRHCATVIPEVNVDSNDWTERLIKLIEEGKYE